MFIYAVEVGTSYPVTEPIVKVVVHTEMFAAQCVLAW